MLAAAAQEDTAGTAIFRLLALREAEPLGIEGLGAVDIVNEQRYRADLGDLERPGQEHALDVEGLSRRRLRVVAREDVDPLLLRVYEFGRLRHLRQGRLLLEAAVIQFARLRPLVPADLLDTVIELVGVAVGIVDIDVPVAARHVAADPLDPDLLFLEIAVRLGDLLQAAALPGDLVDRDLGGEFAVGAEIHHPLREQHKGVVVAAIAHEIAARIAKILVFGEPGGARKIQRVGRGEAEQVAVERAAFGELHGIEAEMAEAADLERPFEQNAADIIMMTVAGHGQFPPPRRNLRGLAWRIMRESRRKDKPP